MVFPCPIQILTAVARFSFITFTLFIIITIKLSVFIAFHIFLLVVQIADQVIKFVKHRIGRIKNDLAYFCIFRDFDEKMEILKKKKKKNCALVPILMIKINIYIYW